MKEYPVIIHKFRGTQNEIQVNRCHILNFNIINVPTRRRQNATISRLNSASAVNIASGLCRNINQLEEYDVNNRQKVSLDT